MDTLKKMNRRTVTILMALMLSVVFCMPEVSDALPKKPGTVTGIRVTSTAYDQVNLKWNKTKNARKYQIYRATNRGGKYTLIKTISGVKFKNIKVETGKTYWYKVRAINGARKGGFSKPVKGTPNLKKPGFTARSSASGPVLNAKKVAGATGYVFYRDGKAISRQKGLKFVDKGVPDKQAHTYKVLAYKKVGSRNALSPFSRTLAASKMTIKVNLKDCNKVSSLKAGKSFAINGKITANATIKRVEIGFVDRNTKKWVSGAKYDNKNVNSYEFDVSKAAKKINFNKLYSGTFSYRIYAHMEDESVVVLLNHTMIVSRGNGAQAIINMATQCAWPYGTPKSKYKYNGGKRTEAYTAALQIAYGDRSGWGKQTRAGASCDVFAGTVIRASGYDTKFPRGLDGVVKHCKNNTDKWIKTGVKSISGMQPGDVVYQEYKGGGGHIMIYLGNKRFANAHYMGKTYGIIEGSGVCHSTSACNVYIVYRPAK